METSYYKVPFCYREYIPYPSTFYKKLLLLLLLNWFIDIPAFTFYTVSTVIILRMCEDSVHFDILNHLITARPLQARLRQGPREGDLQRDLGPRRQRRRQHRLHRLEQQHPGLRPG